MAYRYAPQQSGIPDRRQRSQICRQPPVGTKNTAVEYEWVTYSQVSRRVYNLRGGPARMGVKKGDAVGIIANNRTEWAVCAFAN